MKSTKFLIFILFLVAWLPLQASDDCGFYVSALDGASGDFSRRPPRDHSKPKSLQSKPPKRQEPKDSKITRGKDSVELSLLARAFNELRIQTNKPTKEQAKEAFEARLVEISNELLDPKLRDSEDIQALHGDRREAKAAYRFLVEAGLANPHPEMQE